MRTWGMRQNISWKPLEIETWVHGPPIKNNPRRIEWPMWPMTWSGPERSRSWPPIRLVEPNISKMAGDRRLVSTKHQQEMGYGESNRKGYYWQPTGSRIWEIDWYQHERPWPLFGDRLRSCQPLRHIHHSHSISGKPLVIEAWFQRTTSRKSPMGYQMVTWLMTSRDPKRSNSWSQYA